MVIADLRSERPINRIITCCSGWMNGRVAPVQRSADRRTASVLYAAAASVIATGRLHGLTALQAISNALAGKPVLLPP